MIPKANEAVKTYQERGWLEVLPIPANSKIRNRKGGQGNVPARSADEVLTEWQEFNEESPNLAVRIPDNMVSLDVDLHSKEKNGPETLAALEAELGPLPKGPYSTRHGAGNDQRHIFFRVEPGIKWKAPGPGIDLRQHTHSYCVAWPSHVDGKAYQWFDANDNPMTAPPHVEDFPVLPSAWQARLKAGPVKDALRNAPSEELNDADAMAWLETVAPGYEEPPANYMLEKVRTYAEAMADDAHGTMLEGQRWAIRHCVVEGAQGLAAVLEGIKSAFVEVRKERPRRGETSEYEWSNALASEVNALRGDVEHGKKRVFVDFLGDSRSTDLDGSKDVRKSFDESVNAVVYLQNTFDGDQCPAQIFALFNPQLIVVSSKGLTGKSDSWLYDTESGQVVEVPQIMESSRKLFPLIAHIRDQFDPSDKSEAPMWKRYNYLLQTFQTTRSVRAFVEPLKGTLQAEGRSKFADEFDRDPYTMLLRDGKVLDLKKALTGASLVECVRPRKATDLLTGDRMLGVSGADIIAYAGTSKVVSELYEIAFPDVEVRNQVYRCMAYSLLGDNSHRLFWGLIGPTGTGKGTVTKAYTSLLGSYAFATSLPALTRSAGNNSAKANAVKARVATMSEFDADTVGDVSALKELTGNDAVLITDKYTKSEQVRAGVTLFFETNHVPNLPGADRALRDRLVIAPMEGKREWIQNFAASHPDFARDKSALVGLLEDLVSWLPSAHRGGFTDDLLPKKMTDLADEFISDSDPLTEWIEETFVFEAGACLRNPDLESALRHALHADKVSQDVTKRKVTEKLIDLGAVKPEGDRKLPMKDGDNKRHRGLLGVRLRAERSTLTPVA